MARGNDAVYRSRVFKEYYGADYLRRVQHCRKYTVLVLRAILVNNTYKIPFPSYILVDIFKITPTATNQLFVPCSRVVGRCFGHAADITRAPTALWSLP